MLETEETTESKLLPIIELSLQKENLRNIQVELRGNTEKGDGFTGDILFVSAVGTTITGQQKQYDLALKISRTRRPGNQPIDIKLKKETFIYQFVLPTFKNFQEKKLGRQLFTSYATCFNTFIHNNTYYVALNNLQKSGFQLFDKFQSMDLKHLKLILEEYGKFHALSFALRDQEPQTYQKLIQNQVDIFRQYLLRSDMLENIAASFSNACDLLKNQNKMDVYEKCKNLQEKIKYIMLDLSEEKEPQSAVLHCDCWNNNFLFQYQNIQDSHVPVAVKILDWQISKIASPVFDIAFFIYACSSKNELKCVPELLHSYYDSFASTLQELGSNSKILFTYQNLLEHWKKYSLYGLVSVPALLKMVLCCKEDIPDSYDLQNFGDLFATLTLRNEEKYNDRVIACLEHYVNFTLSL